ncbi:condensation domain-containing protein [Streptacidiphilus griseoplanus]|uniref:condensation domain-containing protein n=1 Tax=Peterkaempfera griseoplana TaxID=66896 RepID=UPI0006E3A410|nr:condensation domain-containing protein [Peterkaempfera griseoplana]
MTSDSVDSMAAAGVRPPASVGATVTARAVPGQRDGAEADAGSGRVSWEPVPFSAQGGDGPMTWGQLHMWRPMQWYGSAFASLSIRQVVPLAAPGVPLDECLGALRRLVEANQTLRTRFTERSAGPRQTVAAEGAHLVELYQLGEGGGGTAAAVEAVADRRARKLAAEPFRHSHEWPVRFALVCRGRRVLAIVMVCSHVALDGWAVERLTDSLRRLLSGGTAAAGDLWQPLDQAEYEKSEQGRRQDARAMRHWRARLAGVPDTAPRPPDGVRADPSVQQWRLTSTALAAASLELAERTRTSSSTVLLTLAAAALCAVRAQPTVAMLLITGNRLTERQQQLMTSTVQDGLLVFDWADVSLEDAVREVYRRSTSGYMRAQYDPDSLVALTDELDRSRRHPLDLTGYFNDARLGLDWRINHPAEGAHPYSRQDPAFVRSYERHDMTYCLSLAQHGPHCQVSLLADTGRLPQDRIPVLLKGLESLLCSATAGEVGLSEVPAALGLPAVP